MSIKRSQPAVPIQDPDCRIKKTGIIANRNAQSRFFHPEKGQIEKGSRYISNVCRDDRSSNILLEYEDQDRIEHQIQKIAKQLPAHSCSGKPLGTNRIGKPC